jgi:hypothetical protein
MLDHHAQRAPQPPRTAIVESRIRGNAAVPPRDRQTADRICTLHPFTHLPRDRNAHHDDEPFGDERGKPRVQRQRSLSTKLVSKTFSLLSGKVESTMLEEHLGGTDDDRGFDYGSDSGAHRANRS